MRPTSSEVIIATYNNPKSLALCLESIRRQQVLPQSICIADDGSGPETKAVIDAFVLPGVALRHVWHEDQGFRKCEILNRAIASSTAEYLIFLDGDVMIHPGFIQRHLDMARRGRFMTGSLIRLDKAATDAVTPDMVRAGTVFDRGWLRSNRAIDGISTWLKTKPFALPVMAVMDRLSPVRPSLCGANASAYRDEVLAVGGFDERMKYGGLDKEFGVRLGNNGTKGAHLRYSAPLVHLDHPRGYSDPEGRKRNRTLIEAARREGIKVTQHGIALGGRV
jgi:glycosyltransferase involved in cell wall biosynthesis